MQSIPHLLPVLLGQDAQPPGVGVAPGSGHIKAGGQLGVAGVGQHQGHFARAGIGGVGGQVLALQQHSAVLRRQLPGQRFEQGGFARAVGADQG